MQSEKGSTDIYLGEGTQVLGGDFSTGTIVQYTENIRVETRYVPGTAPSATTNSATAPSNLSSPRAVAPVNSIRFKGVTLLNNTVANEVVTYKGNGTLQQTVYVPVAAPVQGQQNGQSTAGDGSTSGEGSWV